MDFHIGSAASDRGFPLAHANLTGHANGVVPKLAQKRDKKMQDYEEGCQGESRGNKDFVG